jgi:formiminotetrahydrofolate cyclodeaminase
VSEADRGAPRRLVDLPVRAFVEAVASADRPVPAGGSVAALSGAASAALLALVCGVLQHRAGPGAFVQEIQNLRELREKLLGLVDEDAAAFDAYLDARRADVGEGAAIARMSRTPLDVGKACADIVALSHRVETHDVRHMRGDVRAARHLAQAAVRTSLDIAEANVPLQRDPAARAELLEEISRLRARL